MNRAHASLYLVLCMVLSGATPAGAFSFVWHQSASASLELGARAECWGFDDPDYASWDERSFSLTHPGSPLPLAGSIRAQVPPGDYSAVRGSVGGPMTALSIDADTNPSDDGGHGSGITGRARGLLARSFHLDGGEGSVFVQLPFRVSGSLERCGSGTGYVLGSFRAGIGGFSWIAGSHANDSPEWFEDVYYWTGYLDYGRTYEWCTETELYAAGSDGPSFSGHYNLTTPDMQSPVPEPGSFVLLTVGLALAGWFWRRKSPADRGTD